MGIVRNVLAAIGVLTLVLIIAGLAAFYGTWGDFDPKAGEVYRELARQLVDTGSAAQATVWKMPVQDGLSPQDVETSMKSIAITRNIKDVGELPLYKQIEASTGQPYRFIKIYMFCNAMTAARMIEYDPAYSAYLPCRVTLLEDPQKKLWLYTFNLDLMIHGGKPLPPALHDEAQRVRETILAIMKGGASGAF